MALLAMSCAAGPTGRRLHNYLWKETVPKASCVKLQLRIEPSGGNERLAASATCDTSPAPIGATAQRAVWSWRPPAIGVVSAMQATSCRFITALTTDLAPSFRRI